MAGGKRTGFDEISAEEMAVRREDCTYKNVWV